MKMIAVGAIGPDYGDFWLRHRGDLKDESLDVDMITKSTPETRGYSKLIGVVIFDKTKK